MAGYYVCATDGDDGTGTGAIDNAWATLQKAIDNTDPGDTIHVSNKAAQVLAASITWNTGWDNLAAGTSMDAPLIITVWDNGGALVISHPYGDIDCWELDGDDACATLFSTTAIPGYVHLIQGKLHSTTGILIDPPNYWGAYGCELYDAGSGAMWDTANYGLIAGCYLHTFPANCVGIKVGSSAEVVGNYISAPTGSAISAGSSNGIRGNIIRAANQHGINITGDRTSIRNNTIQGDGSTAYSGIRMTAASEQAVAVGNIIADFAGTGYGVNVTSGGNFRQYGHNHFWNNNTNENNVVVLGQDLGNNLTTDPGFVDAAGGDFRIGLAGKAKGWPRGWPGSATLNFSDTGAAGRLEQALRQINM